MAAIVATLTYLRVEESHREEEAVQRDVEYTQQRLRLRLLEQQEQLMRLAREVSNRELSNAAFKARAESMLYDFPELHSVLWIDERQRQKAGAGAAAG